MPWTGLASALCVTLALGVRPPPSRAQTLPTLPPPAAPASSTTVVASQIAKALLTPPAPPFADGTRLAIQVTLVGEVTKDSGLAAFLADALEAQLRLAPGFAMRVPDARDASEQIELELQVKDGHLMATARRRALAKNLWEALAGAAGRVIATAYANVPIDIELRTLLGLGRREVRLDQLRVVPVTGKSLAALASARVLDCAVADLDADRRSELVVLQTDAVRAAHWAGGGFSQDLGFYPLGEVPPSAAPLREPLGRLVAVTRQNGRVVMVAASSDREGPLVVGLGPSGVERLPLAFQRGWPLYATGVDSFVTAPWPLAIDSLEGGLTEARLGAGTATWIGGASRVHDVRAFVEDGAGLFVAALVGGGVRVIPGPDNPGAGVVSLLVDFDADGAPEMVTTSQVLSGPDRLGLTRLPPPGATPSRTSSAKTLWTGVAPAPITAMCAGDVDRDGYQEVIAATWDGTRADLVIVVPR